MGINATGLELRHEEVMWGWGQVFWIQFADGKEFLPLVRCRVGRLIIFAAAWF